MFFFSVIYLSCISALIHLIWDLSKWSLAIFITFIPLAFEFIKKIKKKSIKSNFYAIKKRKIEKNIISLLILSCLFSILIHALPSFLEPYPLGFDTYRLHIIRINYILKNGKSIIGDIITQDFLNPLRYQWGFHLFLGSLGLLTDIDSILLLRLLPLILSIFYPISIYTASPLFQIKQPKYRIVACIICPLILFDPIIHGLIYPFPSSLALILFIIILRFFYEIKHKKKWYIFFLLSLAPILFFIYKGIGVLYILCLVALLPLIIIFYRNSDIKIKNYKNFKMLLFISLLLSLLYTISLSFLERYTTSQQIISLNIIFETFIFELNIIQFYAITGIVSFLIFICATFFVRFNILKKDKISNLILLSLFISLIIFSSSSFNGIRWLLYLIPFMVFFNIKLILIILNKITYKIRKFSSRFNPRIYQGIILASFLLTISIEPIQYVIDPPYNLNFNFGLIEENLYQQIDTLKDDSYLFTTYKMNRFLNSYAINKTILSTSNNSIIRYFELTYGDYLSIFYDNNTSIVMQFTKNQSIDYGYFILIKSEFPIDFNDFINLTDAVVYYNNESALLKKKI